MDSQTRYISIGQVVKKKDLQKSGEPLPGDESL